MAKSTRREVVKLVSTAGTGYYYTAKVKKENEKLLLKNMTPKFASTSISNKPSSQSSSCTRYKPHYPHPGGIIVAF